MSKKRKHAGRGPRYVEVLLPVIPARPNTIIDDLDWTKVSYLTLDGSTSKAYVVIRGERAYGENKYSDQVVYLEASDDGWKEVARDPSFDLPPPRT